MITDESEIRRQTVIDAAKELMLTARTAPKTRGIDHIHVKLIDGADKDRLADAMQTLGEKNGEHWQFFIRDAGCVRTAEAVLLLAADIAPLGLDCGWCGFADCKEKSGVARVPCAFNNIDLGIAAGSVAAGLADKRIDNRVMYTIGYTAMQTGLLGENIASAIGFPLSVSAKNPFFDRKKPAPPVV